MRLKQITEYDVFCHLIEICVAVCTSCSAVSTHAQVLINSHNTQLVTVTAQVRICCGSYKATFRPYAFIYRKKQHQLYMFSKSSSSQFYVSVFMFQVVLKWMLLK